MHFKRSLYVLCSVALILSGCSSISPTPTAPTVAQDIHQKHLARLAQIKQFSLKGRIGVVTQKQGFSGGIDWQHEPQNDQIEVFSPLGGKVADISKTPSDVTLTSQDGQSIKAKDAESLTEATLGWRLPLKGLSDWALGRPSATKIEASTWDDQGRLLTLKQDGWDISYENYADINGATLPEKILLKSEKVNLKLLVENWSGI